MRVPPSLGFLEAPIVCPSPGMHTLVAFLSARLPLLFPEPGTGKRTLGYALVQGVPVPPDAEMAWLGACMAGADGWVNVCVGLLREGARYP